MKLSIVTINYNDAVGLKKTLESVATQKPCDCEVEHIVVDGGSTDESVDIIKQYPHVSKWISEKDKGVYNAMNKGIRIILAPNSSMFPSPTLPCDSNSECHSRHSFTPDGEGDCLHYIQILNSGDILASDHVIEDMHHALVANQYPEILYGNMLKAMQDGKLVRDNCGGSGVGTSFLYFYRGTLNHDCVWIKRELFDRFGLYDEKMKICSDWKWYVTAIAVGLRNEEKGMRIPPLKPEQIQYVDIDVTIFDMNGISESGGKNKAIVLKERRQYLEEILPASVLADYDEFYLSIEQYRRLKRFHLWGIIYFVERVLFKLEKWNLLK